MRRLLLFLPLQLREGVAEDHSLSLLQWGKKTPGAAAIRREVTQVLCPPDAADGIAAETSLLLLLWHREEAPAGLEKKTKVSPATPAESLYDGFWSPRLKTKLLDGS
jgi:hypothetical protein